MIFRKRRTFLVLLFILLPFSIPLIIYFLCRILRIDNLSLVKVTVPIVNIVGQMLLNAIFYGILLKQTIHPNSECSERATIEGGLGQKVIAVSLFVKDGNRPYVQRYYSPGIVENLKEMRIIYPGWVMRVYTNLSIETQNLKNMSNEKDLFICNTTKLPGIGDVTSTNAMVWRFLPIGDPTVSMFMVRDLDSIVNLREKSAVVEWENSNKTFHTMRDSPYHIARVMGGLWGAKNYLMTPAQKLTLKYQFISLGEIYLKKGKNDQDLLEDLLYRPLRHLFLIHDSYNCVIYRDSIPFPNKREHPLRFVGMKEHEFGNYDPFKCSPPCRPSYGQDWSYC